MKFFKTIKLNVVSSKELEKINDLIDGISSYILCMYSDYKINNYLKFIIGFVLILSSNNASIAQGPFNIILPSMEKYTVIDSANYKLTYDLTYTPDSNKTNTKRTNEFILLIGNKFSKFYIERPVIRNKKENKFDDGAARAEGRGLGGTEILKNFELKKETVTTILMASSNVYTYDENIPDIKWTILTDKKQIYSYQCQKATTFFLGRAYEAWFTSEIPINNGPWKFGNLPGLILQVYDIQKHYTFECSGIQPLKTKEAIIKYDWEYVPISRKNLNRLIKRMFENPVQVMEGMGKTTVSGSLKNISMPYNPLEKE